MLKHIKGVCVYKAVEKVFQDIPEAKEAKSVYA